MAEKLMFEGTNGAITHVSATNPLPTTITPGTGATDLGKAEDAAHTSGDVGVMFLAVRNDAGTPLAGTSGDYIPVTTDSTGALRVIGGSTQYTEDAASAGGESVTLVGVIRQDTIASSTSADGDYTTLKANNVGALYNVDYQAPQYEEQTIGVAYTMERPVASSTGAVTLDTSAAAEASSVTKASAGRLYGFVFSNGNAAVRYLQFFNSTTVPADTAIPFLVFRVGIGETLAVDFPKGIPFTIGICWANSSTQNTKTIGSADSLANVFHA